MKGTLYHLLNRGVDKRKVFHDNRDYLRFVHNLIDFNTSESHIHNPYYRRRPADVGHPHFADVRRPQRLKGERLVEILCWTLMPNHPHLFVMEHDEYYVTQFSRKVFGGYTKYFNERNERSGVLFQGKTKIIPVERDAHFLYLPFYIHLNSLDLFQPKWKENGIKDVRGALRFLEEYRWSNYRDIIGVGNGEFADISDRKLFFEFFDTNEQKYKKDLEEWVRAGGYGN